MTTWSEPAMSVKRRSSAGNDQATKRRKRLNGFVGGALLLLLALAPLPFGAVHAFTWGVFGVPEDEVRLMIGQNAAAVYGFDWDLLESLADQHGPTVEEVARPLDPEDIPDEALRCPAFAAARFLGK